MSEQAVYETLERNMLNYADYAAIPVKGVNESLVPILRGHGLQAQQIGTDMQPFTGDKIYVRQTVADYLGRAASGLAATTPELDLQVVYGYRALSIQRKLFETHAAVLARQQPGLTNEELRAATHREIAVPEVAGHPSGAAVDIQLVESKSKRPLHFGTRIWEFRRESYTFAPCSPMARQNRDLLRSVMLEAGFAPFDGEWWHFSYGDKEWARYYNKPNALYGQVEFKSE